MKIPCDHLFLLKDGRCDACGRIIEPKMYYHIHSKATKEDFRDNMAIGSKPCRVHSDKHDLHVALNRAVAAEMEVERWKNAANKLAGFAAVNDLLLSRYSMSTSKDIVAGMVGMSVEELFGEER
jgi:hypothetical protein